MAENGKDYWNDFFEEHGKEIDRLIRRYDALGKRVPGNTEEEIDSLEHWLEMLRNGEESPYWQEEEQKQGPGR